MIVLYYHPACWTSYRLIKRVGPRKDVVMVNCSSNIGLPLSRGVLSVPLIEIDGRQVYGGPVDIETAASLIDGRMVSHPIGDLRKELTGAVVDSAAASAIVYMTGEIKQLLNFPQFLSACTGIGLLNDGGKNLGEVEDMIRSDGRLYEDLEPLMIRTLVHNIVRESIYVSYALKGVSDFVWWLTAKASVGRLGAPFDNAVSGKARALYAYYLDNRAEIESKIGKEINIIRNDREFLDIIGSHS
ncbi:MAG: hypothetical protein JRN37_02595 [Nitrososphaerota archaeon]|jgi:predicted thioredoxin/glutaredoxin|nr:hypothetical protein [Nitrososphaerota archaeon]MDG7038041.1 hypothetical protein [Nitrososphaerota archaeon]MDG7040515.1 hypothetical protein [Nitrososphaerota archaeon]MDG7043612.1 hypothetical protein [Nitrososphaerota archaeon]